MFTKRFVLVWAVAMMVWGWGGVLSAGLASAEEGPYIGLRGDVGFLSDGESHIEIPASSRGTQYVPANSVAKTEVGFAVRGAIGYAFRNNFRVEGEVGYRRSGLESLALTVNDPAIGHDGMRINPGIIAAVKAPPIALEAAPLAIDGQADAVTLMANVYYDFPMASAAWKPYIGGGLGAAIVSTEMTCIDAKCRAANVATLLDDSETVFAFQLLAGVGYDVELAGRLMTLTLDYSYFWAQDQALQSRTIENEDFTASFRGHYTGVGIRIPFGG